MNIPKSLKQSRQFSVIMKKITELMSMKSPEKYLYLSFAIAYLLMPADIIPDLTPVVGWLDDLLVIVWSIDAIRRNVPFNEWKKSIKTRLTEWKHKMKRGENEQKE